MSGYMSIKQYTPTYFRVNHLRRHDTSHIQKPPVLEEDTCSVESVASTPVPLSPTEGQEKEIRCKPRTSISRAKTAVFEYAICNEWQYFATLTPRGKNEDYYDLDAFMKRVAQWVRNMRRIPGWEDLKYLIVPEKFQKGEGWHLHGLFRGIPQECAVPFNLDDAQSKKQRRKLKALNDAGYLSFPEYSRRFGWATLSPIKDANRVAGYITKYLTKDFYKNPDHFGACLYYPCRGLHRAETVFEGEVALGMPFEVSEDQYWNNLAGCFPFVFHSKHGSFGHCSGHEICVSKNGTFQLKVYTQDGPLEATYFEILVFDNLLNSFVPSFSEWIPVDDPDDPFNTIYSIDGSGQLCVNSTKVAR